MKRKTIYCGLFVIVLFSAFISPTNLCRSKTTQLNDVEYRKMLDFAKDSNSTALGALMHHYSAVGQKEVADFYLIRLREKGNTLSQDEYNILSVYAKERNATAIDKIRTHKIAAKIRENIYYSLEHNLSKLSTFLRGCSADELCSISDMYYYFNTIYQSLPDENKTVIEQSTIAQDYNETKIEPCGFIAYFKKIFSCG